jgi:hypothetical protein
VADSVLEVLDADAVLVLHEVGEQGPTGPAGSPGPPGVAGPKGDPGTTDHALLSHLDYASSGHTGFLASGAAAGGDLAGTYPNPTLKASGTPGTYGDASHFLNLTTDAQGRVTGVTTQPVPPGNPFPDDQPLVRDNLDATKLLRLDVSAFTAGATRVVTLPDANFTPAGVNLANVFTTTQTVQTGTDGARGLTLKRNSATDTAANIFETQTETGAALAAVTKTGQVTAPAVGFQVASAARVWQNGGETRVEALGSQQLTLNGNSTAMSVVVQPSYGVSGTLRMGVATSGHVSLKLNNSGTTNLGEVGIDPTLGLYLKGGVGYSTTVVSQSTAVPTLVVKAVASQTASLQEWQDSSANVLSRLNKDGYFMTRKSAAPADADLATGEAALWLDGTIGASKLMVKAKNSAGTVVTGSIPLA